ncbi:MAG TPA: glutamine--fructose-6-phosphate transaminase (isomerizing) [Actinomycetota bacterium]|jgi:glucosamine--fructose-6-phosphate aminotransferase (isomerizing)|nr:glutamine--fructose-6-phosphate transaminase (isomerizing) [Actinomycetota bacterium]
MCGIVGYVGPDRALPIILEGLRRLEYRGYDSSGVALLDGDLTVVKRAGKLSELDAALDDRRAPSGTVGIGHTRWATHGAPTNVNAHPHTDCDGRIAVIHNGIVENHAELRAGLEKRGHEMRSDTDTEVVAHMLEERSGSLPDRVRGVIRELEGAFALVVVSAHDPDVIVGVKVSSPLVVGLGERENVLASDIPAVLERTRRVLPIDERRVVEVRADAIRVTDFGGTEVAVEPFEVDWDVVRAQKGGYDDFMRKEIDEQPAAIRDTLVGRLNERGLLSLDELHIDEDVLRDVDKVFVVACGTAYHSGLVAKYAIEHWTRLPVEIDIASEFRYRDPVLGPDTLTLAVSQSGETIDTLEAARHAARQRSRVLAVTNTVGSSLAREADAVMYTHAGPEIGVAATKTFATQMVALQLVALYLAQVRGPMFPEEIAEVVGGLRALPDQVRRTLALDEQVRAIAEEIHRARDVLFIGRHTGFPAALEGALKLKEISYLHAEGYPAGELKHGPIALIEEGVPVVAVATECHVYPKMLSNIQEVRARGANVIAVGSEGDQEISAHAKHVLFVPRVPELFAPVVVTPPLQLLAYHVAKVRGCNVDQPRNLAKSVTVE